MKIFSLFAVAAALLVPVTTFGCPGCIAANEESRNAFLFTTALMTFIPLIGISIAVRVIQARLKRAEDDAQRVEDALFEQT